MVSEAYGTDLRRIVKRNSGLLSAGQAFVNISAQINALVGSLAVFAITGNAALSGLVVSLGFVGRIVVPYFSGWLMDRKGRRPVLVLGCVVLAFSFFGLALTYLARNVFVVLIFFLLYGVGNAIFNQIRVAMADMYGVKEIGTAIGYLYTSSIAGSLAAVPIVALVGFFPNALGVDQYASLWIVGSLSVLPALVAIYMIRPDTSKVAKMLGSNSGAAEAPGGALRVPDTAGMVAPFVVSAFTWGIMIAMMSLLSLHMGTIGFPLSLISLTITIHIIGMYAPSLPFGRITDKFGARKVMIASSLICGLGGLLTPLTANWYVITIGMFLVGAGWSGATVSSTAVITSLTDVAMRGRILGLNDVANSGASVVCPFIGGAIIGVYGFLGLGIFGFALSLPAAFLGILRPRQAS